jgi:uncharacterized protein (TIGR04255 family)
MMHTPAKITPDPIIEAIIELRFHASVPDEAVFGIIFNAVTGEFPSTESLPITQLPEVIRKQDPNLAFTPHYQLRHDDYSMLVGPKVITFTNKNSYTGWDYFVSKINSNLSKIQNLNIIKNTERLGLRYVNFFENSDIFIDSNLRTDFTNYRYPLKHSLIRNEYEVGEFLVITQVANNADLTMNQSQKKHGSIIDIDVLNSSLKGKGFSLNLILEILDKAHTIEKETFFSILKEEFVRKLNPEY